MARKYDPKGFIASIDAAIARVALNREMISPLVADATDEDHSKAVELTAKYDALIARLEKLKDACPESHLTIIAAVKEVVKLIVAERENLEARYFAPSLSNAPGNIFIDMESHLQMAESVVSRPARGGRIPSDDDISSAMIQPESGTVVKRLKKKVYVKTYRDQCRDLANGIQSDLDKKGRAVEQLGAQYQEATAALEQINAKILDLGRRVQNGMITRAAAEAEGRRIASDRARWTAIMEARKRNYTLNSAIYDKFVQAWAQHGESLRMVYDNETEDERLVEYFDKVIEVLKRYRGFVNGVAGEGDKNFDFDALEDLLKKVGGDLEAILSNITVITNSAIDPTQQIDVSTDTATQGGFNLDAFLGSADPTMGGVIPDPVGGTTIPTDPTPVIPDIPTTTDPIEENNPFADFTRRHE